MISWYSSSKTVRIEQLNVLDFSGPSFHNYDIRLNPEDFSRLLSTLAKAVRENPSEFEEWLAPHLRDITQLLVVAAGMHKPEDEPA